MPERAERRTTATSSFGVSKRESHDSSGFYERFVAPVVDDDETISPHKAIDEVFVGNAADMSQIADASVALVATSPPYFAGKDYESALGEGGVPATYLEYLDMLESVFAECVRVLEPGGRIAVNVANLGRKPYRSLAGDVTAILQDRLRLLLRGEIVWTKARGSTGSCAWGSFQRPANPVLRDLTERVVVASKSRFDRALSPARRAAAGLPHVASMWRDEFMEATTDVWEIAPESATRVDHPAPFPVELPKRLIHLYTYRGDLVLDPFLGSGSTAVAALRTGRHFAGYDTDAAYVANATERIARERAALGAARGVAVEGFDAFVLPDGAPSGDAVDQALQLGVAAKDLVGELVAASGFTAVADTRRSTADVADFRADDKAGRRCAFLVVGGFTSSRPGLRRTDELWRVIGEAAALHEIEPTTRIVVLTTALPSPRNSATAALHAVTGRGKPIERVLDLADPATRDEMQAVARDAFAE
jgi:DNA modification methylase